MPHRYQPLPAKLYTRNRRKFVQRMAPGSAAIFFAARHTATNADGHYKFTQDSSFHYLTGIDQEDALLFVFPDAPKEEYKEVLFIKKTNAQIQLWDGWKYNKEEATAASGIANVRWLDEWEAFFKRLIGEFGQLYLDFNEHERNGLFHETDAHVLARRLQREYPAHQILRAAPELYKLRMLKEPEEVEQIRRACKITEQAFRGVLATLKPGMMEYEVEAELIYHYTRLGGTGHAYEPIVASGANACTLHYIESSSPCQDGEVLLIDSGAEYGNYSSDLSRSIPVNGKYTARQRAVYNAVLHVHQECCKLLKPGVLMEDYVRQTGELMTEQLLQLGLISQEEVKNAPAGQPAYKKYFPHGVSHHLGLDTHDVNAWFEPFKAGMVFTVEPGIYINEEGLGIRIENDVLITEDGIDDLMGSIPIEVEEIEHLMAEGR